FKPLVAGERDESLELGLADTLIGKLGAIRELEVRPITAVRRYTGLEQDAIAAGREQRVDAVLEGHIQRAGARLRVTVRMLRTSDGRPLWADRLDADAGDIFGVEDSISERAAAALAVELTGEERQRIGKRHTRDPEAYQLYLLGRLHWTKRTPDGNRRAIEYFDQAIAKDPSYGLAYAGLAGAHAVGGRLGLAPPTEAHPRARAPGRPRRGRSSSTTAWWRRTWSWPTSSATSTGTGRGPSAATGGRWRSIRTTPRRTSGLASTSCSLGAPTNRSPRSGARAS